MPHEDPILTCPLDKSHKILKSRMQFHLVRCKKNHDMKGKMICGYNATHIINVADAEKHSHECPDLKEWQKSRDSLDDREIPGMITVEEVIKLQEQAPVCEENWDDESYAAPTYDPYKATEDRAVIRTLMVASKSEKRAWKQRERQKMAQLSDNPRPNTSEVQKKKPPKTSPVAGAILSEVHEYGKNTSNQPQKEKSTIKADEDEILTSLKQLNISEKENTSAMNDTTVESDVKPKNFASVLKQKKVPRK